MKLVDRKAKGKVEENLTRRKRDLTLTIVRRGG